MINVVNGRIYIYHLYSIAEEIDLDKLGQTWIGEFEHVSLVSRRTLPTHIQFAKEPVILSLGNKQLVLTPDLQQEAIVRARVFDFGVVSLRWEISFPASWVDTVERATLYIDNDEIENQSEVILKSIYPALEPSLIKPVDSVSTCLMEDYTIFYVGNFENAELREADAILSRLGQDIARMIRGEARNLSKSQEDEALSQKISYFDDDLVIVDWNAGFIYDPEASNEHIDILEFGNCQLIEWRYYDDLLDHELDKVYRQLDGKPVAFWLPLLKRNPYPRTLNTLLTLLIDVMDLKDNLENSLKIIHDLYSARIYQAISERLRLAEWQSRVDGKLEDIRHIYEALNDNLYNRHSMLLEITITLMIALEIILFLVPIFNPSLH